MQVSGGKEIVLHAWCHTQRLKSRQGGSMTVRAPCCFGAGVPPYLLKLLLIGPLVGWLLGG